MIKVPSNLQDARWYIYIYIHKNRLVGINILLTNSPPLTRGKQEFDLDHDHR
jgi:hypothetical protein